MGPIGWKRTVTTLVGTAALAAVLVNGVPANAAPTAKPAPAPGADASAATLEAAAIKAYLTNYPGLTEAQARAAYAQQRQRKAVYERVAGDTFGGAWFDPRGGVLHLAVTSAAAEAKAADAGRSVGVPVSTHRVKHSYADLQRQADALRRGTGALSQAARGQVGIDVPGNRVVAALPAGRLAGLRASAPAGVALAADPGISTEEDAGCTSRNACDYTIRAGSMLWYGSSGYICSVGFTARTSSNQRYVYTAGHCNSGSATWGTGGQSIGPMTSSIDSGAYDAGIIRVDNSWFAYDAGGEIYQTLSVNYVAPTLSYIWVGDVVCLAANYPDPGATSNLCGTVGSTSDASVRGMVRVDGLDACPGDSGGGWYWLGSSTYRVAYGIHSRSDTGCHGDQGGSRSWFSPLPTVAPLWGLTVETR
ncbi:S1 family peptidase [Rhizomonospora bruguierae]|uniref:S1 family peptidase n=1 Tax=Rhizomonospora bruguierae TaxID=1581705 RepID=UPI001BCBB079|nr:S1 family peptidase [Micromonospora sp. NBRC 107566]